MVDSSPLQLLRQLQVIEKRLGRKKTIDKGPRNIDLDILLFENYIVEHEDLHIPHKAMLEREFVLRPLCEYVTKSIFCLWLLSDAQYQSSGPISARGDLRDF